MIYYAASDLHGDSDSFFAMLNILDKEDYHLFFLGDAADRGPIGYTVIKWLLNNPNVTYLKGNHEDMFVRAAYDFYHIWHKYWSHETLSDIIERHTVKEIMGKGKEMRIHRDNGGISTFNSWLDDGAPMDIIHQLEKLPVRCSYNQYDMCHAGSTIEAWENESENYLLEDRMSFCEPWYSNRVLIHGHTPIPYMPAYFLHQNEIMENPERIWAFSQDDNFDPRPLSYYPGSLNDYPHGFNASRGMKINIDGGAVFTGCFIMKCLNYCSDVIFE